MSAPYLITQHDTGKSSTHSDSKPPQCLCLIFRNYVFDSMLPDPLQSITVDISSESWTGVVVLWLSRITSVSKDSRSLFNRLIETHDIERHVRIAMVYLHPRILATVPWVHGAYVGRLLCGSIVQLATSTLAAPPTYASRVEAACGLAAELRSCGEDVWGECGSHCGIWGAISP